jgi:hypothetical protein
MFGLFGGVTHNMLYYNCPRCGQQYYLDLGSGPVNIEQVNMGEDLRIGSMTISSGSHVNVSGAQGVTLDNLDLRGNIRIRQKGSRK